ncbi:alpha/beta fold hydrolase [Rhodobacter sp. 24-YEA-8]|uniref:alpha/beta fold hydrolase n=1 Tax=Rhodobacter sp. 24-YEA-8 TaxID=1884310 RepID=UPI0008955480|nr:alpha/beta fold hydrolase [Rhodobacter sp. 24-YEA-8]SED73250.1 3-oxoadipate enol-lactonase [Rhodobacter sp. 24-YEA-8]
MPDFEHKGCRLRYEETGEGRAMVFVHGVGSTLEAWDPVLPHMPPGRHIRLDLRGHGASGRAPGPYSLELMAGDVLALINHLGLDQVALFGFSLGGLLAQQLAIHQPERLSALALISTVAGRDEGERARVEERLATLERDGPLTHLTNAVERWFTPEFLAKNPDAISARRAKALENDPACYMAAYRVLAHSDLAGDLHRITTPTLVMTGEADIGSTPRMSRLMHDQIRGSDLAILPGLKHSILLEAPGLVARHLGALLTKTIEKTAEGWK